MKKKEKNEIRYIYNDDGDGGSGDGGSDGDGGDDGDGGGGE